MRISAKMIYKWTINNETILTLQKGSEGDIFKTQ